MRAKALMRPSLVLSYLTLIAGIARADVRADRELIGWLGETYSTEFAQNITGDGRAPGMEVLSWYPRIFKFRKILTEAECDEIIRLAKPRISRSGVANAETGKSTYSDIRTSSGMFFTRGENRLIKAVEERLARWTMLPMENGEGMQVLHYEKTQKYDPHHDYFSFKASDDNGGNRMATVLMYLSEPTSGGETVFPKVAVPANQTRADFSECAMKGLAVKPMKGDAVVFWSIQPDGRFDVKSLHGSCPVITGEKWSATKWLHYARVAALGEREVKNVREKHVPPSLPVPEGCKDSHDLCAHWAESDECVSNPGYMVGGPGAPGACIMSCGRCDLMIKK